MNLQKSKILILVIIFCTSFASLGSGFLHTHNGEIFPHTENSCNTESNAEDNSKESEGNDDLICDACIVSSAFHSVDFYVHSLDTVALELDNILKEFTTQSHTSQLLYNHTGLSPPPFS